MYEEKGFIHELGWEMSIVDWLLESEIGVGSTAFLAVLWKWFEVESGGTEACRPLS